MPVASLPDTVKVKTVTSISPAEGKRLVCKGALFQQNSTAYFKSK